MTFAAKILADSMSPDGVRLTTFEITFPRIILAEFNTHRVFSRNSASSRAIPVEKMIKQVQENPYVPSSWGKNQKGMQAGEELSEDSALVATSDWLGARDAAVAKAKSLLITGVHKQLTNRLLEPFMWHTVIVTATEWSNFFHQRNNVMAHPDIQRIAAMMQELYETEEPKPLQYGRWHLPLVDWVADMCALRDLDLICADHDGYQIDEMLAKISVGRCARVSYLTHDGKRDLEADIRLHDELLQNGHMSPFEHVARPATVDDDATCVTHLTKVELDISDHLSGTLSVAPKKQWHGNLCGWVQYRKMIPNESDILRSQT